MSLSFKSICGSSLNWNSWKMTLPGKKSSPPSDEGDCFIDRSNSLLIEMPQPNQYSHIKSKVFRVVRRHLNEILFYDSEGYRFNYFVSSRWLGLPPQEFFRDYFSRNDEKFERAFFGRNQSPELLGTVEHLDEVPLTENAVLSFNMIKALRETVKCVTDGQINSADPDHIKQVLRNMHLASHPDKITSKVQMMRQKRFEARIAKEGPVSQLIQDNRIFLDKELIKLMSRLVQKMSVILKTQSIVEQLYPEPILPMFGNKATRITAAAILAVISTTIVYHLSNYSFFLLRIRDVAVKNINRIKKHGTKLCLVSGQATSRWILHRTPQPHRARIAGCALGVVLSSITLLAINTTTSVVSISLIMVTLQLAFVALAGYIVQHLFFLLSRYKIAKQSTRT